MKKVKATRRQFMGHTVAATAGTFVLLEISHPTLSFADDAKYTPGTAANPGTVSGTVKYDGKVPKPIMKDVTDNFDVAGKAPRVWEGLNLGAGNVVKDAVVYVKGVSAGKAFAEKDHMTYVKGAEIHDRAASYGLDKPTIEMKVENRDPIFHSWILMQGKKQLENVPHPPGKDLKIMKFSKPGLYEMRCGPHPWERAFRMVVPHPYFAMTDANGKFEIKDLPAGKYKAVVWAEGISPKEFDLDLSGASATLNATLTQDDLTADLKKNV